MGFDPSWDTAALVKELCDTLVAKGHLKDKPAFIRTDREAKLVGIFESVGLDGAKMASFDNPGPLEMLLRKGTNGEVWVAQVQAALVSMLPESAAKATKKMPGMDDATKAELEAAKSKTAERRDRLEQAEGDQGRIPGERSHGDRDGGKGGRDGGKGDRDRTRDDRDGGRGDDRLGGRGDDRPGRDEPKPFLTNGRWNDEGLDGGDRRGGRDGGKGGGRWDRDGGDRRGGKGDAEGGERRGGPRNEAECYNCGGFGHLGRDCPEQRRDKGKGKGRDRRDRVCDNCGQPGHKSRECPEPVNPEAVQRRLDAKAAREAARGS